MAPPSTPGESGSDGHRPVPETRRLLRLITCGSVDDGKSTLLGRLICEAKALFGDQLAVLEADSRKVGTRGGDIDYALVFDGLASEREQGITIDVAYRHFSTAARRFIVADAPGHEQYTRNMVTGASTADLAIVLIDASKGVGIQTRRHSYLVSLMGIRHIVLAINKMDLVGYSDEVFDRIRAEYVEFATRIGLDSVAAIPTSGVHGDNIVHQSPRTPWFAGTALLPHLDSVQIDEQHLQDLPFRLPVQWVNRSSSEFRGFAGTVVAGVVKAGDRVKVSPSGRESAVLRIVTADGDLPRAVAHQSVTLTLADEVDVSRGDVITHVESPVVVSDQIEATVVWMNDQPMLRGRSYLMKLGTKTVTATVMPLKYKINVNTLEHAAATTLALNEIGVADLELDRPVAFDSYATNRDTGGFILIDKLNNWTVGAGMIRFGLRRADNLHWQAVEIDKRARRALNGHASAVIWFTGLSGAGKSTLADLLERRLHALGKNTYLLDGDNVRHGLNKDLGFTAVDRVENIRRVAEVAKLMVDAGVIVLAAFISPFRAERRMARSLVEAGEFIEVFVDTPLAVAEARDPKGLYKKARSGELRNFTGIDSPYEPPEAPEIRIDTTATPVEDAVEQILQHMRVVGMLDGA